MRLSSHTAIAAAATACVAIGQLAGAAPPLLLQGDIAKHGQMIFSAPAEDATAEQTGSVAGRRRFNERWHQEYHNYDE